MWLRFETGGQMPIFKAPMLLSAFPIFRLAPDDYNILSPANLEGKSGNPLAPEKLTPMNAD